MPEQIMWYQQGRVIHHHFYDLVTLDDIHAGNDAALYYIRRGLPPVHSIVDGLDVTKAPLNVKGLYNATSFFKEPNLGWVVFVTRDPMLRFFSVVASQLAGAKFRVVDTMDEAVATLHRLDPTLAMLPVTMPIRYYDLGRG